DAAKVAVKSREVEVNRAKDLRSARKTDLERVRDLVNRGSLLKDRLEAATLDYQASERAVEAAEADVEKAKGDEAGKAASLEKAQAEVEPKRALVEGARRDRDAAVVQLGYTRVYAPFDGVIVSRTADPGKFVSGTTGWGEPLITVARTDLVTVVIKLPDHA